MYHSITIVGRLGRKPEMRYTPSGQGVTSFSVATDHQYTNGQGERVEETVWFRVSVWGKQAEACNQYLDKGSKVLVEGRMTPDKKTGAPRIWESEGKPATSYEVNASTVRFLSSRADVQASAAPQAEAAPAEDELPF